MRVPTHARRFHHLDYTGFAKKTAWTGAGNAFLARDINGNGKIDDISEMFGNATQGGFAFPAARVDAAGGRHENGREEHLSAVPMPVENATKRLIVIKMQC